MPKPRETREEILARVVAYYDRMWPAGHVDRFPGERAASRLTLQGVVAALLEDVDLQLAWDAARERPQICRRSPGETYQTRIVARDEWKPERGLPRCANCRLENGHAGACEPC